MSKQLVAISGHRGHPPQPSPALESRAVRRVGMLDRAALHLGVALITWGRRPVRVGRRSAVAASWHSPDSHRQRDELRTKYLLEGSDLPRFR